MAEHQIDKIVGIIGQINLVYPRLTIVHLTPRNGQLIGHVHVAFYVVDGRQRAPAHEFADSLHFWLRFEHE